MARRLAALAGFIAVIVLAVTLLYRVYIHHRDNGIDEEEGAVVNVEASLLHDVKIARLFR